MFEKPILSVESLTVNVKEAAKMLGVCPKTVSNLTKRGVLPVIRIAGRVLYSREALIDFVRRGSKYESSNGNELTDIAPGLGEVA